MDLIENYFENSLNPEEKVRFEELLKNDPEFKKELAFQQDLKAAITLESRNDLKDYLRSLEQETTPKKMSGKMWLYIAASLVLLLGIGSFFFSNISSNDKLFASYFEPYPNTEAPIVRTTGETSLKDDAFYAYEREDYAEAVILFNKLIEREGEDYAFFYKGISLAMAEKYDEAASTLSEHNFSDVYNAKRDWYLALLYLKLEKNKQATQLLHQIIDQKSFKWEKAQELLKKLSK